MDYWQIRELVSKVIPRYNTLFFSKQNSDMVREKGRKKNYHQFDLVSGQFEKQERLLNPEEVNSFVEISCRASACPMPLNLDVWDGLFCPFGCKYCFANAFRASLYTAFFDNSKTLGLRHCKPSFYLKALDALMKYRGKDPHSVSMDIGKAVSMNMPIRFGIRFEDFNDEERTKGVSLDLLRYFSKCSYPVMINTKSDLIGEDNYVEALSSNKAGAAVHVTMISSDEDVLKRLEPGAPTFRKRIQACKNLTDEGVRVVARIEPYLIFAADSKHQFDDYVGELRGAGIKHITLDTYSYSANNQGIRQDFINSGFDWDRFFLLESDSQGFGSLLIGSFIKELQREGFSCSTFDMGNMDINNQTVCCEVGDLFEDSGFNYGCSVSAARFIINRGAQLTRWTDFEDYVNSNGGFLSEKLRKEVRFLWNNEGNEAYSHSWAAGIHMKGIDENGMVWNYEKSEDYRMEILKGVFHENRF